MNIRILMCAFAAGFLLSAGVKAQDPVSAVYRSGTRERIANPVEGGQDIKLVWEEEKTVLEFPLDGKVEAGLAYTATIRMGQYGGKAYAARPIELSLVVRSGEEPWQVAAGRVVSNMVLSGTNDPGTYGAYSITFNPKENPALVGKEQMQLRVAELEAWTQGYIGGVSLEAVKLPDNPPNILFFLVDDLGWPDIGCFGSTFYETPNCDRLAETGMRFTDAYAAGPVCSPSRVGIMTGKYPVRVGATEYFGCPTPTQWENKYQTKLLTAPIKEQMELGEVTLAEALQAGGYKTFFAGKWHCGEEPYWPQYQGFEINKGGWTRGGPYGGDKYFSPYGNPMLSDGPKGEHLPDRLAEETVRFMRENRDKPFFAYLSFYSVHTPLMSRPDLQKKYEEKRKRMKLDTEWGTEDSVWDQGEMAVRLTQDDPVYAGMVEAMDLAVGKVLDALDRLGLADNTIVVFTSDNGGLSTSGSRWMPTTCAPLRTGKGWLYEGGIRVPAIVRWPGVVKPGGECAEAIIGIDFYPTLLDAAGLPPRPEQHCDGVSLVPLLKGRTIDREAIYWHYPHYGNQGGFPGAIIRQGDWKLIEKFEGGIELYNLKDDIGEQRDLCRQEPERVESMLKKLKAWQKDMNAAMPAPNPNSKH